MATEAPLLTLAEYAGLDESDDRYVSELVRGVLVREPRPGRTHGRVQARLVAALQGWADDRGAEVTTESGYLLADDPPTLRGPDVAVMLDPDRVEEPTGGWVRGAPALAVEVVSPSDTSAAVQQKVMDYLEAGARRVWIVDPSTRTVTVHRPDRTARVLRSDETLAGDDVLEDFAIPLRDLFE